VHETEIDGSTERRLSTFLVTNDPPGLLPPDAGNALGFAIKNLVGGHFHNVSGAGGGAVRDLALVQQDEIVLVKNDGFGGFPELSNRLAFPGLLPDSLTLLPSVTREFDRLLFCGSDSRIGVWQRDEPDPKEPHPPVYQPLDALSAPLVHSLTVPGAILADTTRMQVGDVDGDGIPDLVVLLSFAQPTPGETARLALLRGKPSPAPNEFPFFVPTTLTPVHGKRIVDHARRLHERRDGSTKAARARRRGARWHVAGRARWRSHPLLPLRGGGDAGRRPVRTERCVHRPTGVAGRQRSDPGRRRRLRSRRSRRPARRVQGRQHAASVPQHGARDEHAGPRRRRRVRGRVDVAAPARTGQNRPRCVSATSTAMAASTASCGSSSRWAPECAARRSLRI
jgi:hypothetical protein